MERTDREIIDFMKRFSGNDHTILAMGQLLAFMGIADGPVLALEAREEIAEEKDNQQFLKRAYTDYLKTKKASEYISFEVYLERVARGEIK